MIDCKKQVVEFVNNLGYKTETQIVIDLFEDFEEILNRDETENPIERDELGAQQYLIGNILEVMDKKLKHDISNLKKMYELLDVWAKEIEQRNIILGIPKEKG